MNVILEPSEETILNQLHDQGIPVDFQCLSGYCGSCRKKIIEGEVEYFNEPIAAIASDEILPCCSRPKTKIEISI